MRAVFSYTRVTDLIFGWSGATPERTSPNGVGSASSRSTSKPAVQQLVDGVEARRAGADDRDSHPDQGTRLLAARPVTACVSCIGMAANRINVSLEPEYSEKLARLAERMHVQEGTLAKSLLSTALDGADPEASHIVELLDSIPGAHERTREGVEQARRGEGIPLSELA